MKAPLLLALLGTCLAGCATTQESASQTITTDTITARVGNDADEHGCKASAGYTWSVVKNNCIRVWETGIQLKPTTKQGSYTTSASIILSENGANAELFIASEKGGVLLAKQASAYAGNGYELHQANQKWQLSKDSKVIYSE